MGDVVRLVAVDAPRPSPDAAPEPIEPAPGAPIEPRRERLRRHGHRARLYATAIVSIALLVILVALTTANLRSVKLDWIVGSTHASLVWIILVATVIGWLLGVLMSILFRHRTRRPRQG
jgi:uncharacterized integral membrane protein